jgi:hypothetical protein
VTRTPRNTSRRQSSSAFANPSLPSCHDWRGTQACRHHLTCAGGQHRGVSTSRRGDQTASAHSHTSRSGRRGSTGRWRAIGQAVRDGLRVSAMPTDALKVFYEISMTSYTRQEEDNPMATTPQPALDGRTVSRPSLPSSVENRCPRSQHASAWAAVSYIHGATARLWPCTMP